MIIGDDLKDAACKKSIEAGFTLLGQELTIQMPEQPNGQWTGIPAAADLLYGLHPGLVVFVFFLDQPLCQLTRSQRIAGSPARSYH
jgi:hypothetical protein